MSGLYEKNISRRWCIVKKNLHMCNGDVLYVIHSTDMNLFLRIQVSLSAEFCLCMLGGTNW